MIGKFCPSDSVRPTDRLHALNVCSCYVNNHFKQRARLQCNPEELNYSYVDTKTSQETTV